jgi:hypothetical protein
MSLVSFFVLICLDSPIGERRVTLKSLVFFVTRFKRAINCSNGMFVGAVDFPAFRVILVVRDICQHLWQLF